MKKNISINISGIIFHIEEDAYEQLRDYLQKINRYFSSFEDSDEIVADIESRIAEIFLSKLSDEKQVITSEDVSSLITTMGDVKDFQAMEEEPVNEKNYEGDTSGTSYHETETKKVYRDESHKIIGGVCSGLGHYFMVDPVWIRLLTLLLFFGYGVGLLVYVVLWIVLPAKSDIPSYKSSKKLYRDPDDRVLGGVSSGLSAFFGVDTIVFRLLFVILTLIGGAGILLYIILWIAVPEARTISEKVQMTGDPVTLSNIETNIKKNLNIEEKSYEDPVVKILLFPFRIIAAVINGLAKILGPVLIFFVEAIRVLAGVMLCFIGLAIVLALLFSVGTLFGIFASGPFYDHPFWLHDIGIPWDVISHSFPFFTTIALFVGFFIPGLIILLLGVSVIAKRIVFNAVAGWSLFALFIVAVIILSINIPAIVYQFREDGRIEVTENFNLHGKTPLLKMHEIGMEDYNGAELRLTGHEDSTYQLVKSFRAQGSSRIDAMSNAEMTTYSMTLKDSVFNFDSNLQFVPDAIFRGQEVDLTFYLPYNTPFFIDYDMTHLLRYSLYQYGLDYNDYASTQWAIDPEDGLVCLTCPKESSDTNDFSQDQSFNSANYDSATVISSFQQLAVEGPLSISIFKGSDYKILFNGKESSHQDLYMENEDGQLSLNSDEPGTLVIFTPSLQSLSMDDGVKVLLTDFQQDYMEITLDSNSELTADIDIQDLKLKMEDRSTAELRGKGNLLDAELRGFSELNGYNFHANEVNITTRGKSKAEVYAAQVLKVDKSIGSKVDHQGNASYMETE